MSDNLLNKLTQLKLPAMAVSLIRQRETPQTYGELSFEERLNLLADDELLNRENGRVRDRTSMPMRDRTERNTQEGAIDTLNAGERPVIHTDRGGHYRWP